MNKCKYKRALVTGGAGFIGSHLCQRLVNLGIEVIVIDDLSNGRNDAIPEGAKLTVCSVADRESLGKLLGGVDIVFHLAARTNIKESGKELYEGCSTNIMGTVSLLSSFEGQKVKKVVFTSSAAVYGEGDRVVSNAEDHPTTPISPYGISKLASELLVSDICVGLGIDYQVLRLFNVFGPGQRSDAYAGVVNEFIRAVAAGRPPTVWGNGEQVRDFIHIDDVIDAFVLAMDTDLSGQVINIGTGRPVTVNSLARLVLVEMQSGLEPKHTDGPKGEIQSSVADIRKAERLFGYRATGSIEDKISTIISWLSENSGQDRGIKGHKTPN